MAMLGIVITCREFDDFIVSYLDKTLPQKQRLLFQAHLALCAPCRRYLKSYEQTIAASRAAHDQVEAQPAEVPDDLVRAILTARRAASGDDSKSTG